MKDNIFKILLLLLKNQLYADRIQHKKNLILHRVELLIYLATYIYKFWKILCLAIYLH